MSPREVFCYREGAGHQDLSIGGLKIHKFQASLGVEHIRVPEHVLFLVDSDVTKTEVWSGVSQPQRDWIRGDLAFLPAGTDLSSPYVSRPYDESVIRVKTHAIMDTAERSLELSSLDLRYIMLPRNDVLGISRAIVNLAEANQRYRALPMLIETLEQSLHVKLICSLSESAGKIVKQPGAVLSVLRRKKALDFIEANLGRHISLGNIADAAAMSPYHFNRAFRATMGITPVRYVWARRVVLAKIMLRDRNMPIAEVALSCGFTTQSHFTTAFRMATGTTPAEYRKAVI